MGENHFKPMGSRNTRRRITTQIQIPSPTIQEPSSSSTYKKSRKKGSTTEQSPIYVGQRSYRTSGKFRSWFLFTSFCDQKENRKSQASHRLKSTESTSFSTLLQGEVSPIYQRPSPSRRLYNLNGHERCRFRFRFRLRYMFISNFHGIEFVT